MSPIARYVTRELVELPAGAPCTEAARLMAEERIGSIAVRDGNSIVGIVTERDLVTRVLSIGAPPQLPIRDAMRSDLPWVTPSATASHCTTLMRDHATRHLLVKEAGRVVGVVSMRDVIRLMLDEKQWLIGQLQNFIEGHDGPHAPLET